MPNKASLLVVDRDAFLAGLYARKFEAEGWKVAVAESFADAQKMLSRKKFSILLIEPDDDPSAAEALIRSSTAPVVILTTVSEQKEIVRMKAAGAAAYLLKGNFVPSEVVVKVKGLLQ